MEPVYLTLMIQVHLTLIIIFLLFQTLGALTIMTDSVLQYKSYEFPPFTQSLSWCITIAPLLPLFYAGILCYRNDYSSFKQVSFILFYY